MIGKNSVSFLRCLAISIFLLSSCGYAPSFPYAQDAEFELAASYYQKSLLIAKDDKQNAIKLLQKSLDIFNKLGNEEWQQKVKKALESIK